MDWESIVQNLPRSLWESLDGYMRYAYLKTYIPFCCGQQYGLDLRSLDKYLDKDVCA
jgi:hypothetical protein